MSTRNIRYTNRDFDSLRTDLQNFVKNYFPNAQKDFSDASTGQMFLELCAYVGDVLSFYEDEAFKEIFLDTASDPQSILSLAYMLGYKPKGASNSVAKLKIQAVITASSNTQYNTSYAPTIQKGSYFIANNEVNTRFELDEDVDFTVSSTYSPISSSAFEVNADGDVQTFLVTKYGWGTSGDVKTYTYAVTTPQEFLDVEVTDTNIVGIESVYDSNGNRWYEVEYLAQDKIEEELENNFSIYSASLYSSLSDVPKVFRYISDERRFRRFVTRYDADGNIHLQFGPGIYNVADEELIHTPEYRGIPNSIVDSTVSAVDPKKYLNTRTLGSAPANTTLTIKYRVSNAEPDNCLPNTITNIGQINSTFKEANIAGSAVANSVLSSVVVNNDYTAIGARGFESLQEIKYNAKSFFAAQGRMVTQADIEARARSLPGKYGYIAKTYAVRSSDIINNVSSATDLGATQPTTVDVSNNTILLYILSVDSTGNFISAPYAIKHNLRNYLARYKMLSDSISIVDPLIVNFSVNFSVMSYPGYNKGDVLFKCIQEIKKYFSNDNMQINQQINIGEMKYKLHKVEGVRAVNNFIIRPKVGTGYANNSYDFEGSKFGEIIPPTRQISVFELKNPDTNIIGTVQ